MKNSLLIIPEEFLKQINDKQDEIIELLKDKNINSSPEFITEAEAKEIFKRKSTWFWQMRKAGVLPFSKIGKSIYYSSSDLKALLERSKFNSLSISKK
jgi:hypothetical protein